MDYIVTFDDGSQALMHHGVKGMHWGQWNSETAAKYGKPGSSGPMGGGGGGDDEDEEEKRKREEWDKIVDEGMRQGRENFEEYKRNRDEAQKKEAATSMVDKVIAKSLDTGGKNMLAGMVKKAQDKAHDEYGLTKTVENKQGHTKTTISAHNPTYNLRRTNVYEHGKRMGYGDGGENSYVRTKDGKYTNIMDLNKVKKRQMS